MYWIILFGLLACVSGYRRDSMFYEDLFKVDSDDVASHTRRDDNSFADYDPEHEKNMFEREHSIFGSLHRRNQGLNFNTTHAEIENTRLYALRTAHKRRCEMSVTSIIEREKYCQLCTCYLGQWVCMFATSCYYKYDFSNKMCKDESTKGVTVYFQKDCFVCNCEAETNLMRCVKNPAKADEDYCKSLDSTDVLGGQ